MRSEPFAQHYIRNRNIRIFLCSFAVLFTLHVMGQGAFMHVKPAKNPGAAFVMGLFVPGAGQLYNDQVELGTFVFAATAGLVFSGAAIYGSTEYSNAQQVGGALMVSGGVAAFGTALYAAYHSRAINRRNGMDDRQKQARRVRFGPASDGLGLALQF